MIPPLQQAVEFGGREKAEDDDEERLLDPEGSAPSDLPHALENVGPAPLRIVRVELKKAR
jgi:hypothetical protein